MIFPALTAGTKTNLAYMASELSGVMCKIQQAPRERDSRGKPSLRGADQALGVYVVDDGFSQLLLGATLRH